MLRKAIERSAAARGDRRARSAAARVEIIRGNLLSREDCAAASKDVAVIFHLAAGRGEKSFPDAFMNSVVTTRNLLDASLRGRHAPAVRQHQLVRGLHQRREARREGCWTSRAPSRTVPELRGDAYCFAKVKQDELVAGLRQAVRCPVRHRQARLRLRPGQRRRSPAASASAPLASFCTSADRIAFRLTYVDNCAEAIVLAGLHAGHRRRGVQRRRRRSAVEPQFLRLYKRHVGRFTSDLSATRGELRAVPALGEVFALVRGAVAARVQSPAAGTPTGRRRATATRS